MKEQGLAKVKEILAVYPEYIDTLNDDYDNALMIASRTGNQAVCEYLITSTQIDYNQRNNDGNFLCIALKDINLFKSLVNNFFYDLVITKVNQHSLFQSLMKIRESSKIEVIDLTASKIKTIDSLNLFESVVNETQSSQIKNDILKVINMYKFDFILPDPEAKIKIVKI